MTPKRRIGLAIAGFFATCSVLFAIPAVTPQSSPLLAPAQARADGFGHDARIKNDSSSVVKIRACKKRVSDTKCAPYTTDAEKKSNPRMWLNPGKATPAGQDWDGFWCPANAVCKVTWLKVLSSTYKSSASKSLFVPVSGCAGCIKLVKVTWAGGNGGGGGGGW